MDPGRRRRTPVTRRPMLARVRVRCLHAFASRPGPPGSWSGEIQPPRRIASGVGLLRTKLAAPGVGGVHDPMWIARVLSNPSRGSSSGGIEGLPHLLSSCDFRQVWVGLLITGVLTLKILRTEWRLGRRRAKPPRRAMGANGVG